MKSTSKLRIKNILIALTGLYLFFALGCAVHTAFMESAHAEKSTVKKAASDSKPAENNAATPGMTAPAPPPLLQPGTPAPPFSLKSALGQETIALRDFKGRKKVLVEFFATWCPHCRHSVPILKKLDAQYPGKLQVLSVNVGDRPGAATSLPFIEEYKINYPVLIWPDNLLTSTYKVSGVPTVYLIDESGIIRWNHTGTLTPQNETEIMKLLKK